MNRREGCPVCGGPYRSQVEREEVVYGGRYRLVTLYLHDDGSEHRVVLGTFNRSQPYHREAP